MKKHIIFSLIFSVLSSVAYTALNPIRPDMQRYFNTKFLANRAGLNQALRQEGFQEVTFKAQDGLSVQGLYLQRQNARYTIICCAGWMPGAKEGMAPIYAMLPTDCNILMFDARGHNQSEGSLFDSMMNYGLHEYKDIIGAIKFVRRHTNTPLFIHGWCAGAYHAARAVVELHKSGLLSGCNIKGLVFDSGWVSVTKAAATVPAGYIKDYIMKSVAAMSTMNEALVNAFIGLPFSINYRGFEQDALVTTLHSVFSGLITGIYEYFLKGVLEYNESTTNLLEQVKKVGGMPVPVMYIHSEDDACVAIDDVKELAQHTKHKLCWWIDQPSKHVCHHLKYTHNYAHYMNYFIDTLVYR